MPKKKRFKRIIVFSDSEDSNSDVDLHQPHPRKKPRLPNQVQEGGFNTGVTPRQPDTILPEPSSSNDIYRSNDVIVISDDESSEETSVRKRLRTSDEEAAGTSKPWDSPVVISDSDDDCLIITPTAVTDNELDDCLERSSSEEQTPLCNIHGCFIKDITSSTSPYVTHFQETKQELVNRLFKLYNQTVFESKLPGTIPITWSKRLTVTAGQTINMLEDEDCYSRIQISERVCDSAERVRDTLIHEMCHSACWLINGIQNDGHGQVWRSYTEKAARVHPELPPVTTFHNYTINFKFIYECEWCPNRGGCFKKLQEELSYCQRCGGRLLLVDPADYENSLSVSDHAPSTQTSETMHPEQKLNPACSNKRKRSHASTTDYD